MSYQLVYDIVKIAPNTFIITSVCYYFKNKIDSDFTFFKKNILLSNKTQIMFPSIFLIKKIQRQILKIEMKSIKTIIQMKLHKKTSLNTQSLILFTLNLKYQTIKL